MNSGVGEQIVVPLVSTGLGGGGRGGVVDGCARPPHPPNPPALPSTLYSFAPSLLFWKGLNVHPLFISADMHEH